MLILESVESGPDSRFQSPLLAHTQFLMSVAHIFGTSYTIYRSYPRLLSSISLGCRGG